MKIIECKKLLKRSARISLKKEYPSDAATTMFMVFVLELLEKIAKKKKRKPSAFNLFVAEQTRRGLTLVEAAKKYKEEKSQRR